MPQKTIPTSGEMTHEHRVILGSTIFGLYMLGMATTNFERTDEWCAMDNVGVPFLYENLTDEQRAHIEKTINLTPQALDEGLAANPDPKS